MENIINKVIILEIQSQGEAPVFSRWEQKSVTENTHRPLQRLCKVFGGNLHSLSYNRMELPQQREALWTLHKCLVLWGWTALEAGGKWVGTGVSCQFRKAYCSCTQTRQNWHCPGHWPRESLFPFLSATPTHSHIQPSWFPDFKMTYMGKKANIYSHFEPLFKMPWRKSGWKCKQIVNLKKFINSIGFFLCHSALSTSVSCVIFHSLWYVMISEYTLIHMGWIHSEMQYEIYYALMPNFYIFKLWQISCLL